MLRTLSSFGKTEASALSTLTRAPGWGRFGASRPADATARNRSTTVIS